MLAQRLDSEDLIFGDSGFHEESQRAASSILEGFILFLCGVYILYSGVHGKLNQLCVPSHALLRFSPSLMLRPAYLMTCCFVQSVPFQSILGVLPPWRIDRVGLSCLQDVLLALCQRMGFHIFCERSLYIRVPAPEIPRLLEHTVFAVSRLRPLALRIGR